MQTLAIGLGRSRLVRALGRNRLVRGSDRLEALLVMLVMLALTVAVPVAGAIGTGVHQTRSKMYAEEAKTRRSLTATAIDDSSLPVGLDANVIITVRARWSALGAEHNSTVGVDHVVKAGQQFPIWVDSAGGYTSAPVPVRQAVTDGIAVAVLCWGTVAAAAMTAVVLLRRWLDRKRFMQWENEFRDLVDNGGRKRSQQ
jgi:hypothetical protein